MCSLQKRLLLLKEKISRNKILISCKMRCWNMVCVNRKIYSKFVQSLSTYQNEPKKFLHGLVKVLERLNNFVI